MTKTRTDRDTESKVDERYPVSSRNSGRSIVEYGDDPFGDSFDIEEYDTWTVTKSHKYGRRVSIGNRQNEGSYAYQDERPRFIEDTAYAKKMRRYQAKVRFWSLIGILVAIFLFLDGFKCFGKKISKAGGISQITLDDELVMYMILFVLIPLIFIRVFVGRIKSLNKDH